MRVSTAGMHHLSDVVVGAINGDWSAPPLPRAACFTSRRGSTAVTDEPCQLAQIWFESLPRGRRAAPTIDAHLR